jgi:hypothetical protein
MPLKGNWKGTDLSEELHCVAMEHANEVISLHAERNGRALGLGSGRGNEARVSADFHPSRTQRPNSAAACCQRGDLGHAHRQRKRDAASALARGSLTSLPNFEFSQQMERFDDKASSDL